jgi:ribonuclease Z
MKTLFLGTAAGKPSTHRNVTSIAVLFDNSEFLLVDCGEATQHQIMRSTLKITKLRGIYITHLHGDHIFGLPGLLCSMNDSRTEPLTIFGPSGLKDFLRFPCKSIHNYNIVVEEFEPTSLVFHKHIHNHYEGNYEYSVEMSTIDHGVTCFAYKITKNRSIKGINMSAFHPDLNKYRSEVENIVGKPAEKIINKMKKGEKYFMKDGFCFDITNYCNQEEPYSIVIALDNFNSQKMQHSFVECDILVHECTYAIFNSMTPKEKEDVKKMARSHKHSTNMIAYQVAKNLNTKRLILTHFSNRYEFEDESKIIDGVSSGESKCDIKIDCARDFSIF